LSPSITSTLAFHPCTTLFFITRSTRHEKYKRGRRRTTNLNYPKLQYGEKTPKNYPKNYSKLLPLLLKTSQGIYRRNRATGSLYGAACQITARGSTTLPRKRDNCHVSAANLGGARGAACCTLSACPPVARAACYTLPTCPPVGYTSWFLDLGPQF